MAAVHTIRLTLEQSSTASTLFAFSYISPLLKQTSAFVGMHLIAWVQFRIAKVILFFSLKISALDKYASKQDEKVKFSGTIPSLTMKNLKINPSPSKTIVLILYFLNLLYFLHHLIFCFFTSTMPNLFSNLDKYSFVVTSTPNLK